MVGYVGGIVPEDAILTNTKPMTEQEVQEWLEHCDALDRALCRLFFDVWWCKNMSPSGSVNAATAARALPKLVHTTIEFRAALPLREVRRFFRVLKRQAFLGDLAEQYNIVKERSLDYRYHTHIQRTPWDVCGC